MQALSKLRVATLGSRLQTLKVKRGRLRHLIDTNLPALRDSYSLLGAEATQIVWNGNVPDIDAALSWTGDTLRALLQQRAPELQPDVFPLARPASPSPLPPGKVSYRLRHVPEAISPRMPIQLDVLVDGLYQQTLTTWFGVRGTKQALRLKHDMHAGASLSTDMVEKADVPINNETAAALSPSDFTDEALQLKADKRAGELLLARDLARKKPVERGSNVVVRVQQGSVTLQDTALALTDGTRGAPVRLLNPRTHEPYLATVVDVGIVEAR
jgi:flagella basal body P-ring formation protein FlgA